MDVCEIKSNNCKTDETHVRFERQSKAFSRFQYIIKELVKTQKKIIENVYHFV